MTRTYERPQRHNPHQLTIKQHCFPKRSIERFTNEDGLVQVHLIEHERTVFLKADDSNFCALRTWDQRAEDGFMKEIEDKFQNLADLIAEGNIVRRLTRDEKDVITDMYILWNCRWHWKNNPIRDTKIKGISDVSRRLSKDEQECLEKAGIGGIRPDLTISGRDLTGVQIQLNFENERERMRGCNWAILNCRRATFVVPDNASDKAILPLTPNICLINGQGYQFAREHEVLAINAWAMQTSDKYYFSRSLCA